MDDEINRSQKSKSQDSIHIKAGKPTEIESRLVMSRAGEMERFGGL